MNPPGNSGLSRVTPIGEYASFESLCEEYRCREDVLCLISQLNQLCKAVQKHRGMSMALIGGNMRFRGDFAMLQYQVDRRIASLRAFIHKTAGLINTREEESVSLAWQTIRRDWQDDKLSDNFELHSHFIEQLQSVVYKLARKLEKPLLSSRDKNSLQASVESEPYREDQSSYSVEGEQEEIKSSVGNTQSDPALVAYPQTFQQMEVINFIAKELPDMIESVAKIRGLSTYITASEQVDYHTDRKLRFFLRCGKQQSEKLLHQSARLQSVLSGALVSLPEIGVMELKLIFLLETVENDVLGGGKIKTNSHQLFKLGTELIDVYWLVINEGLVLVRSWHEQNFETWLKQGSI